MWGHLQNQNRIDQSRRQMLALDGELSVWVKRRQSLDSLHQYHSQLESISAMVRDALSELAAALPEILPTRPAGEVYDACRALDVRVLWLRRVWDFFREKFDQRDDPVRGPLLRAADEVVWSCYRPAFLAAQVSHPEVDPGPAPLPFVESRYSPEAFPRELVPQDLKREVDLGFLHQHLAALPVPLVRIPPTCVTSPWWLIYLAHELGHHVQYRLLPGRELEQLCADRIGDLVKQRTGDEDTQERWRGWSREIFADFYSILMTGPWAIWAMVELELRAQPAMTARRPGYPSPLLRLYLMAEAARLLGLQQEIGLRGLDLQALAAGNPEMASAMALATDVAREFLRLPAYGQSLTALCGFDAESLQMRVDEWRGRLWQAGSPDAEETLSAARLATAGAVAAWADVGAEPDQASREDCHKQLRSRVLELVAACREPGTRAAQQEEEVAAKDLGVTLGQALLKQEVPVSALRETSE